MLITHTHGNTDLKKDIQANSDPGSCFLPWLYFQKPSGSKSHGWTMIKNTWLLLITVCCVVSHHLLAMTQHYSRMKVDQAWWIIFRPFSSIICEQICSLSYLICYFKLITMILVTNSWSAIYLWALPGKGSRFEIQIFCAWFGLNK